MTSEKDQMHKKIGKSKLSVESHSAITHKTLADRRPVHACAPELLKDVKSFMAV